MDPTPLPPCNRRIAMASPISYIRDIAFFCFLGSALITIIVFIYALYQRRLRRLANPHNLPYLPGPKPLHIIGNLFEIARENETATYQLLAKKYGRHPPLCGRLTCWLNLCRRFGLSQHPWKKYPLRQLFWDSQSTLWKTFCELFRPPTFDNESWIVSLEFCIDSPSSNWHDFHKNGMRLQLCAHAIWFVLNPNLYDPMTLPYCI